MALIKCEECGKQISDKAQSCPSCGAPAVSQISASNPPASTPELTKSESKTLSSSSTWFILITLAVGILLFSLIPQVKQRDLPPLPVEVGYRSSLVGEGLVLKVKNNSTRTLTILATLSNKTLQTQKTFNLTASPNEVAEIGHLEGWKLVSGDAVALSNAEYHSWESTIP